jgi:hypothetical protein
VVENIEDSGLSMEARVVIDYCDKTSELIGEIEKGGSLYGSKDSSSALQTSINGGF